jgi:hypothetical protein
VDASTRDRLGPGQALLGKAREVFVFDHHAMKTPDINATEVGGGEGQGRAGEGAMLRLELPAWACV